MVDIKINTVATRKPKQKRPPEKTKARVPGYLNRILKQLGQAAKKT